MKALSVWLVGVGSSGKYTDQLVLGHILKVVSLCGRISTFAYLTHQWSSLSVSLLG